MKKMLFFAAIALAALGSCTSDDYVGDNSSLTSNDARAINFGSGIKAVTRAPLTEGAAATALGNNFVVEGVKWNGDDTKEVVFDHYNVNWGNNTANTTTSNTNNWEYVAQTKHADATIGEQTIKYWDYAKSQYDFIAYSVGLATPDYTDEEYDNTKVKISAIDATKMNGNDTSSPEDGIIDEGAYTIQGKADELAKVYIADLKTSYRNATPSSDYQNVVQLKFRSLSAKVRIGLYETIPGYSVKEVRFYSDASTELLDETEAGKEEENKTANKEAKLFTSGATNVFNAEGTYIVYFPTTGSGNKEDLDYNKAHVAFTPAASNGTSNLKTFGGLTGSLATEGLAGKERYETEANVYLGRTSDAAIYAGAKASNYYTTVLPNETGAVLNLKVDYTLLSTDGSTETIKVHGATAQVPAAFAQWKSGYAYTYLFKISQNTNGVTDPTHGPAGIYPITFDAVVTETEDGVQETITTVSTPSITTYAKGNNVTANNEYKTGSNIYVVVENAGNTVTLSATDVKLYTVTIQDGAAQTINESSVANALANGVKNDETTPTTWTVTDKNGKMMVVTAASGLSVETGIPAADAPDGKDITVSCAKFTPSTAGTYAFEYTKSVTTYIHATGTYVSGTTYYTDNTGAIEVDATGFTEGVTDVSSYFVSQTSDEKTYKIIKVVAAP